MMHAVVAFQYTPFYPFLSANVLLRIFHSHTYIKANCWRALARQQPILYNSEKTKSVGCNKIEDMSSQLCFLYPGTDSGVPVNARGNIDRLRAIVRQLS